MHGPGRHQQALELADSEAAASPKTACRMDPTWHSCSAGQRRSSRWGGAMHSGGP